MIQSQALRILALLRSAPDRAISCGELAKFGLFHKAASRCSDLKKQGYEIEFIQGREWHESKYRLTHDIEDIKTSFETQTGQGEMPILFSTLRFE